MQARKVVPDSQEVSEAFVAMQVHDAFIGVLGGFFHIVIKAGFVEMNPAKENVRAMRKTDVLFETALHRFGTTPSFDLGLRRRQRFQPQLQQ